MKPKHEINTGEQSERDSNSPSIKRDTENSSNKVTANEDEPKKDPKRNDENLPENEPVKLPNKQNKPATDPGDPEIKPGEKEKTKGKIPVNHPGNKQ